MKMGKNKVGRNDPCPCGSGKKYKQCCLLKGDPDKNLPEIILADVSSMRMNYLLLNMDRDEFMRAYKGPSMDIERSVMRAIPSSPNKNESEKALIVWKDRVEEEIKRLCSKHSKYYWLFLLRRIFPETTEPYDRPTTPYLHRTTFNLAVLKYGKSNQTEEFVAVPSSVDTRQYIFTEEPYSGETVDMERADAIKIENEAAFKEARQPPIIPRQITREDAINIYQVEYLALDYYMITAQLRRLWKGGQLRVHLGRFAGIVLPKKVEDLVKLYDERSPNYGNLLSSFGTITDLNVVKEKESLDNFMLFVPFPNIEKYEIPLVLPGEEFFDGKVKGPIYLKGNPTNFVPTPVSIRPFYEKMCMFRQTIKDMLGFSPEEFVAFLIAVGRHHQSFWLYNIFSRYNFFQSGYTLMPHREDFQRYLEEIYLNVHKRLFGDIAPERADSSFKGMLNWMTYQDKDFENISLWDRTGAKLFLRVPGGLLTDHSAVPAILESIFSELSAHASVDGKVGQLRGGDFEKEVEKYLKLNIPDFQPWLCHRKLRFLSGLERDIDVSFLLGQTLFIVECKAFSVPPAFDRGEIGALQTRESKLDSALDQVDTLCELLCEERKGKNFELPRAITHIIAIVASPFPEYIPKRSDRYFLTAHIPRVCVLREIVEFVKQFRLSTYLSKPFVWKTS
jgi:hypothetical protein